MKLLISCLLSLIVAFALPLGSPTKAPAEAGSLASHRFYIQVIVDYEFRPGSLHVAADVDGRDCGAMVNAITAPSEGLRFISGTTYTVDVASEDEKPGCGAPGRTIRWTVDGRPANQDTPWPSGPGPTNLLLSAGPMPMILTGNLSGVEGLAGNEPAEVTIGGHPCGRIAFVRAAPRGVGGIDAYGAIVLPYEADPHCGRDGDRVQVTIAGRQATAQVEWREGRQRVDLTLAQPAAAAVMSAGDDRWQWLAIGFAAGTVSALVLVTWIAIFRRRLAG